MLLLELGYQQNQILQALTKLRAFQIPKLRLILFHLRKGLRKVSLLGFIDVLCHYTLSSDNQGSGNVSSQFVSCFMAAVR
jgi:hypothetical protein